MILHTRSRMPAFELPVNSLLHYFTVLSVCSNKQYEKLQLSVFCIYITFADRYSYTLLELSGIFVHLHLTLYLLSVLIHKCAEHQIYRHRSPFHDACRRLVYPPEYRITTEIAPLFPSSLCSFMPSWIFSSISYVWFIWLLYLSRISIRLADG